ncbi:hypothetical protein MB46_00565 [Arthrobacter alpinus]|uniref:hypothetical protein n=1 Tax=Arthrobacter alpinus TaxID=656366 RepID=UPI0005CA10C2|nr:hypothetical protein [Arthrobacter alpinus]ALV44229.1 hypothetical protein MB46_00565 [Arthrobacter alpinus]
MKTGPTFGDAEKILQAPAPEIHCSECNTAEYLTMESIQALSAKKDGWMAVDYSCGNCESYYAHDVSVEAVMAFTGVHLPGVGASG